MRRVLAALFLLLAFLLSFAGTAWARAVLPSETHVGVSGPYTNTSTYEIDPLSLQMQWEDTTWSYDFAPDVLVYVNQNPWSRFDPEGLDDKNKKAIDDAFEQLPGWQRWFAKWTGMEKGMKAALKGADSDMDESERRGEGRKLTAAQTAKRLVQGSVPDIAIVAGTRGVVVASGAAVAASGISDPEGPSQRDIKESNPGGAKNAPPEKVEKPTREYIYGPKEDKKVNPDGSTNENTWTTPDEFKTQEEATDKLDPFKPVEGRRPVMIPEGTTVKKGITPGNEGHKGGSGGANETLIPEGLPPGSAGEWKPLPKTGP